MGDPNQRVPRTLGGYRILDTLGQGSFATVYRAQREGLPGFVALKVMPPHVQGEALERFKREAKLASRLEHPGIVRCFDVGYDAQRQVHYLGLEFVEGHSLEDRVRAGGALPWRQAVETLIPVADAVAYAHGQEVIHRDLKPANVLVDRSGAPRVTDFGLARDNAASEALTVAGEVLGTPYYMAPEQIRGEPVSPLFDVHALAAILYELLTSTPPYPGQTVTEVSRRILAGNPPAPSRCSPYPVPPALDALVLEGLATNPQRRTQSATGFALALRQVLRAAEEPEDPVRVSPKSLLGFALGAGGGLLLGLIALLTVSLGSPPATAPAPEGTSTASADAPLAEATPPSPPRPSDPKEGLDEVREHIRAWDWRRAKRDLAALQRRATGELRLAELRRLRKRLADERELEERAAVHAEACYYEKLDGWRALDVVEEQLALHPRSDRFIALGLELNSVCGQIQRASELGAQIDFPAEKEQRLLTLLEHYQALQPGSGKNAALWGRWLPLFGANWHQRAGGELFAQGPGSGEYELAGLLLKEPRTLSPPYVIEAEVRLDDTRPVSYAGVAFAVEDARNMVLVYLFHHDEVIRDFEPEQQEKILEISQGRPKFCRLAAFIDGVWQHYETQVTRFPDNAWAKLKVEVKPRSLQAYVAGQPLPLVQLPRAVVGGRIGVVKYYDTDAGFRGLAAHRR